jgi:predicted esterase
MVRRSLPVRSRSSFRAAACACVVAVLGFVPSRAAQDSGGADDVDHVPSRDLRAGGDENKRYFLIGAKEGERGPNEGFKLLLVLPGGNGNAEFLAFVKRVYANALNDDYLVAQLVAPVWAPEQAENLVWPTEKSPWPKMKFTTEAFIDAVLDDVVKLHKIDPAHVFLLAWSSSGPATYAYTLAEKTRATGAFVAMSVFKPDELPPLKYAKGRAWYLYHSPEDFIPIAMAEKARDELKDKKAEVELATYAGGHGWKGDVYGDLRRGVSWLEQHHAKPPKPAGKK